MSLAASSSLLEITLQDIIYLDWNKSILEIQKIYPGGELRRENPKKRTLAYYKINVELSDLNTIANVTFHQNEEYIRGQSKVNFTIRMIELENLSEEALEKKFREICRYIKSIYPRVLTNVKPEPNDAVYSLYEFDEKGSVRITLNMDSANNSLRIDITH